MFNSYIKIAPPVTFSAQVGLQLGSSYSYVKVRPHLSSVQSVKIDILKFNFKYINQKIHGKYKLMVTLR